MVDDAREMAARNEGINKEWTCPLDGKISRCVMVGTEYGYGTE
jgi:hypothetical protein